MTTFSSSNQNGVSMLRSFLTLLSARRSSFHSDSPGTIEIENSAFRAESNGKLNHQSLSLASTAHTRITSEESSGVAILEQIKKNSTVSKQQKGIRKPPALRPAANHRARLLSMDLQHVRLCSIKRAERLSAVGISSVGDLASAEPLELAKRLGVPAKAEATLRRYQQAIRMAASVPGLMPREAMLLVAIHRRTARALSIESPALVHRDLERFALSTRGQRQLRGHRVPSIRRIRKWIDACSAVVISP